MKSNFQLYNYFRSSASYRVRIGLHWKKVEFEYVPVHLVNQGGQQYQDSYKDLNPMSQVPTLVHYDQGQKHIISQSVAILEYLEDILPSSPALFPKDALNKALIRQCVEILNSGAQPFGNLATLNYLEKELRMTADQKSKWIQHWFAKALSSLEKICEKNGKGFLVGPTVTAADLFLIPHLFTSRRFECDLSAYPYLLEVEKKCLELEAFQKAHPSKQIDSQ